MKVTMDEVKEAAEQLLKEKPQYEGFFNGNANGLKLETDQSGRNFFISGAIAAHAQIPITNLHKTNVENVKLAIERMVQTVFHNLNNKTMQLSITCNSPMKSLIGEIGVINPDDKPEEIIVNVFQSYIIPENAIIIHPHLHDQLRSMPSSKLKNTKFLLQLPWWEKVVE